MKLSCKAQFTVHIWSLVSEHNCGWHAALQCRSFAEVTVGVRNTWPSFFLFCITEAGHRGDRRQGRDNLPSQSMTISTGKYFKYCCGYGVESNFQGVCFPLELLCVPQSLVLRPSVSGLPSREYYHWGLGAGVTKLTSARKKNILPASSELTRKVHWGDILAALDSLFQITTDRVTESRQKNKFLTKVM